MSAASINQIYQALKKANVYVQLVDRGLIKYSNECGVKGISYNVSKTAFRVVVTFTGKPLSIGQYSSPVRAARRLMEAYDEYAISLERYIKWYKTNVGRGKRFKQETKDLCTPEVYAKLMGKTGITSNPLICIDNNIDSITDEFLSIIRKSTLSEIMRIQTKINSSFSDIVQQNLKKNPYTEEEVNTLIIENDELKSKLEDINKTSKVE